MTRFVVWTKGQPSAARVVGYLGMRWHLLRNSRGLSAPVTAITLAGLNPMQIAQIWEEGLNSLKLVR